MNIPRSFDLYIENKLSKSERNSFEKEISENEELSEFFHSYLKLNEVARNELDTPLLSDFENDPILKELMLSQRLSIEEDFRKFSNKEDEQCETEFRNLIQEFNPERKNKRNLNIYLSIAALIVTAILISSFVILYNSSINKSLTPIEAYEKFFQPENDSELLIMEKQNPLIYKRFFDLRRSISEIKIQNDKIEYEAFLKALLLMKAGSVKEAQNCFINILNNPDSGLHETASYYLSLSYFYENKPELAITILERLSKTKNPYQKPAGEILKSIKPD